MTDYYKLSLELLRIILLENQYDFWANWITEDIENWKENQSTEHHLRAYGGMGSFNDIVIGNHDISGLWQGAIFGHLQSLAYGLANGEELSIILQRIGSASNQISGWRCRSCGASQLTTLDIERFIRDTTLPQIFIEFLQTDRLTDLLNIDAILSNLEIKEKRVFIEKHITEANIEISNNTNWLWTCPKCSSNETCAYRWILLEDNAKIIEASDNLPLIN